MHPDALRDFSTHPTGETAMPPALASVIRRLHGDFQPDITMTEIVNTVLQCRNDLDAVPDPALPELVERLARQRLPNCRAADHRHDHH
jgi:hypothetical protein